MKVALKEGVSINGAQPELVLGIMLVASMLSRYDLALVVTSITDGDPDRLERSKHKAGLAFDARTWDYGDSPEYREHWRRKYADTLGPEWDVVDESDHFHCEFDPPEARDS